MKKISEIKKSIYKDFIIERWIPFDELDLNKDEINFLKNSNSESKKVDIIIEKLNNIELTNYENLCVDIWIIEWTKNTLDQIYKDFESETCICPRIYTSEELMNIFKNYLT